MFRDRSRAPRRAMLLAMIGVLVAVVLAVAMTVWLVFEVRKEQQAIAELLRDESGTVNTQVSALPAEMRIQLVFSILVLAVLVVAAIALLRVFLAYLASQESLHEVETLSWNIFASMDRAVVTTDCHGLITSMNPAAYTLLHIGSECVGRPLTDISTNEVSLDRLSHRVLQSNNPVRDCEYSVVRGPRKHRLRIDCHLLVDTDKRVFGTVLYVRDITDRILVGERIRRMERFLGLGSLAAGLQHEIKNPLSALSLHVQLLEEHLQGESDTEVTEDLGVLKTEMRRISGVLEGFQDFATLDTLNRSVVGIVQIVRRTVRLVRPQAEGQHVQITLATPTDELPPVSVDVAKLEQVLLNIILNALEEMPTGGQLKVRLGHDEDTAWIEIMDTGPGIPERVQPRIFDPYFTTKSEGSGMGLAVCEKIIQQHSGQIDFDTGPNGTTFRLSLPAEPVS